VDGVGIAVGLSLMVVAVTVVGLIAALKK
jgi:hypothetical protein